MAQDFTFKPFSGVGIVGLFPRLTGTNVGGGIDLGEAPVFKVTQQVPFVEMNTSRDTSRGVAFRMAQRKGANVEIQLRTVSDPVLALLTGGAWTEIAASTAVTGWVAPADLVVGHMIRLPAKNVSAVTVTDSTAGSPKTLPPAQYDLDLMGGTLKLLDIASGGPYVQPFKVNYTPGAVKVLGGLKVTDQEYLVQLNGTNAHDGERGIFEGFKFRFAADGDQDWISEEYGTFTLRGALLQDPARTPSSAGGQYYDFIKAG